MPGIAPFRRLRAFARETRGSVSVEFVIMMPILFWAFMASYVFFDGFRQSAVNLKAAYTISDLISRETGIITEQYVDSMHSLMRLMVRSNSQLNLRITVIRWDEGDARYYVQWSTNRGYNINLTDATIGDIEQKLPVMPDNDIVILVETINTFVPPFNIGMQDTALTNFVFTRPRFTDQVRFEGV